MAFIQESNQIEGEHTFPDSELPVYQWFLANELTEENLKEFHRRLCEARKALEKNERGVYRKVPVYVGRKEMPNPGCLRRLMTQFFGALPSLSPYEAHKRFEAIHPFLDINGRTGRAFWLHMMGEAPLGFLHTWYYQSLN